MPSDILLSMSASAYTTKELLAEQNRLTNRLVGLSSFEIGEIMAASLRAERQRGRIITGIDDLKEHTAETNKWLAGIHRRTSRLNDAMNRQIQETRRMSDQITQGLQGVRNSVDTLREQNGMYQLAMWLQTPDGQYYRQWVNRMATILGECKRRQDLFSKAWNSDFDRMFAAWVNQDSILLDPDKPRREAHWESNPPCIEDYLVDVRLEYQTIRKPDMNAYRQAMNRYTKERNEWARNIVAACSKIRERRQAIADRIRDILPSPVWATVDMTGAIQFVRDTVTRVNAHTLIPMREQLDSYPPVMPRPIALDTVDKLAVNIRQVLKSFTEEYR